VAKFDNILQTIGRTPAVRINKLAPDGINLFVKIEAFNPMGSVKDRLALGVIEDAEASGRLAPGQTVIEATSGNTGIGLAMVCAQKGYPLVVTMAESFSVERRKMMRFLGVRVVLTPASEKGTGMVTKAEELADKHGWFLCRQFENEANANMHSKTTAVEILQDFSDDGLDYWVTGFGTGGTLKGVARVLSEKSPQTKIIVCEPDNSQILGSGVSQLRNEDGAPAGSHPSFRPHVMQGWSPDFIPKLTEDVVAAQWIDKIVPISGADAMHLSRQLAQKEGIFAGVSGGATFAGALKVSEAAPKGSTILCMLPDTGERYLSTPLFDDVPAQMTADEQDLSRSTPSCRFDVQATTAPPPAEEEPRVDLDTAAGEFFDQAISDPKNPVVVFALEWCEFCWSVRKMFEKFGIPYRAVELDSVAYQTDDRGGKIRTVLNSRYDVKTIPQIFVGGELVGGCTEVFDAHRDGGLQKLLDGNAVPFDREASEDPYSFLPTWLHPR
jgi:cysteine synthase